MNKPPGFDVTSLVPSKPMDEKSDGTPSAVINDRALASDGPASKAVLPVGTKVIAVTNPNASENAQKQALKRNREVFGADHVIETAKDCTDGDIVKGKKIKTSKGTTLTRDVCEEKR